LTLIKVEDAYACFAKLLEIYNNLSKKAPAIEQPSYIDGSANLGDGMYLGAFSYISKNATIGNNVTIYPNSFIGENVKIGDNTTIHPGVKIYQDCSVGANCIIHAGAVIGSDGFGFAPNEKGEFQKVPQIGNVVIEDNVEIGALCTIDAGVTGITKIGKGTKLDNQIQIGHDTVIGEHCLMASGVGIAGCVTIKNNVTLWGQVGCASNVVIENNVVVYAQSGIGKNLEEGKTYFGSPCAEAKEKFKELVALKKLPTIFLKNNDK
jgi:UDP-3-O-[3-hydroxymyristoyl] glucosamine N-acyltransferase